jgi:putative membrane protein
MVIIMLDLPLACAHHMAVFGLFGVLVAQAVATRAELNAAAVSRLARMDIVYGLCAMAVLVIGFARASLAAKGWYFYSHNLAFWAKVGVFAVIGVISIGPTLAYRRWQRAPAGPGREEVSAVQRQIRAQLLLFALLPLLAAAMARGLGQF